MSPPAVERRREARHPISVEVSLMGEDEQGEFFTLETSTVDLSARGAAVLVDRSVLPDTLVELTLQALAFSAWARVRSTRTDPASGAPVVGLEYLGGARNPDLGGMAERA